MRIGDMEELRAAYRDKREWIDPRASLLDPDSLTSADKYGTCMA
jgi:hypothetical protein